MLGVGKKKHDSHADQWWARAFDDVLKGVNAPSNNGGQPQAVAPGSVATTTPSVVRDVGMRISAPGATGKTTGLYGNFIQGESLMGTLGQNITNGTSSASPLVQRSGVVLSKEGQDMADRAVDFEPVKKKRKFGSAALQSEPACERLETKEERKQRREEKRTRKRLRREARETMQNSGTEQDVGSRDLRKVGDKSQSQQKRKRQERAVEGSRPGVAAPPVTEIKDEKMKKRRAKRKEKSNE